MKKLSTLIAGIVAGIMLFGGIAYANDWLKFEGSNTLESSNDKVEEIVDMLKEQADKNDDLIDEIRDLADKAHENAELKVRIEQLEQIRDNLNAAIKNKDKEIGELKKQVEANKGVKAELEKAQDERDHYKEELKRANKEVKEHGENVDDHYEDALDIVGDE